MNVTCPTVSLTWSVEEYPASKTGGGTLETLDPPYNTLPPQRGHPEPSKSKELTF